MLSNTRRTVGWTAAVLAMFSLGGWAVMLEEVELTLEEVPDAVRETILQEAAGAPISEIERESMHRTTIYEAEWSVGGRVHEAAVTAEGAVMETEETIPLEEAPAAVRTTINQHFGPDVRIVVEKKMIVIYEAEAKFNGSEQEVLVFPTGQIHEMNGGDDDGDRDDDDGDDDDDDDDGDDDDGDEDDD